MQNYFLENKNNFLPKDKKYIIIGDVHGCIDELKTLLAQHDFFCNEENLIELTAENKNKAIILLGDFVDKGNEEKIQETILFLHKNFLHLNQNRQTLYLILGNHEEMVYRYIMNDPSLKITPKSIENREKYYNTVTLLEKKPLLKKLFLELYSYCQVWLKYEWDQTFSVTLTHAPCEEKYLAKNDQNSSQKMIKCLSRSKNPSLALDKLLPYTHQEAKENQHYHIFGHLSQKNVRHYKNKICIDTSAIYGNRLTSVLLHKNQLSFDFVSFQNKQKASRQTYNTLFNF